MYRTGPRFLLAAALLALALGVAGCGGGGEEPAGAATTTVAAETDRDGDAGRCLSQVGGFLGSLDRLRDQLVGGVTYTQYIAELNDARAAYAKLPVKTLRLGCLERVATKGEASLNRYIRAAEIWSDCVEVPGCPSSSIEGKLRRTWRQGSSLLTAAEDGLAGG